MSQVPQLEGAEARFKPGQSAPCSTASPVPVRTPRQLTVCRSVELRAEKAVGGSLGAETRRWEQEEKQMMLTREND